MNNSTNKQVSQQWISSLLHTGYVHNFDPRKKKRLMRVSRLWRKIFNQCVFSGNRVFEFGCGGAAHLVPLALRGWSCVGIDVSPDVLSRAQDYISHVSQAFSRELDISLQCIDFFEYASAELFDLVFHVGVLEHFLNTSDRLTALQKMCDLALPGGYVVSVVPSGMHPLRQKMKKEKLGGYDIPEIDYTNISMKEEFEMCGLLDVVVLPHNLFYYLTIDSGSHFSVSVKRLLYLVAQCIPEIFLPSSFLFRHSGTLICIGRKK